MDREGGKKGGKEGENLRKEGGRKRGRKERRSEGGREGKREEQREGEREGEREGRRGRQTEGQNCIYYMHAMIVHAHVNIDSMNRGRWTDGCLFSLTSDVFQGHFS